MEVWEDKKQRQDSTGAANSGLDTNEFVPAKAYERALSGLRGILTSEYLKSVGKTSESGDEEEQKAIDSYINSLDVVNILERIFLLQDKWKHDAERKKRAGRAEGYEQPSNSSEYAQAYIDALEEISNKLQS